MTREEAKKRLEVWLICGECPEDKQCYDSYLHSTCEYTDYCDEVSLTDAVKVAISALSENKGEWIAQDIHNCCTVFKCSKCGYEHNFLHLYGKPTADYPYCPNCGAKMRGESDVKR